MSLVWNHDPQAIPMERPVLVKLKGGTVPFMAIRTDYERSMVNTLLGDTTRGYGVFWKLERLENWAEVMDAPARARDGAPGQEPA